MLESFVGLLRSLDWVGTLDFLRLIGQAGSLSSFDGGGGRGEELISPIRRSVRVSCAFVGTPFRRVLFQKGIRSLIRWLAGRVSLTC